MKLSEQALTLLANREHSSFELKRKLLVKGHPPDEVELVLAALACEGLQSDARYTEAYVRFRIEAGFGPLRIHQELQRRGISASLIDQYLNQNEEFWWQRLRSLWQRKYNGTPAKDDKEYARRARFLIQRGFDSSLVYKLLG